MLIMNLELNTCILHEYSCFDLNFGTVMKNLFKFELNLSIQK